MRIPFLALCAAEGEGASWTSILIQYAIYLAIIVVGLIILGIVRRKQKPMSHEDLKSGLIHLSEEIASAEKECKNDLRGQYDFFRSTQKLMFATDKLIYKASVLADKERDSGITNITLSLERVKELLSEYKQNCKSTQDFDKLHEAIDQIRQAIAAADRILERDKLLKSRRAKKNG